MATPLDYDQLYRELSDRVLSELPSVLIVKSSRPIHDTSSVSTSIVPDPSTSQSHSVGRRIRVKNAPLREPLANRQQYEQLRLASVQSRFEHIAPKSEAQISGASEIALPCVIEPSLARAEKQINTNVELCMDMRQGDPSLAVIEQFDIRSSSAGIDTKRAVGNSSGCTGVEPNDKGCPLEDELDHLDKANCTQKGLQANGSSRATRSCRPQRNGRYRQRQKKRMMMLQAGAVEPGELALWKCYAIGF
jgi:hypothetical protein